MSSDFIIDDGDLRKYRVEIPNMAADELPPFELALYIHYKRVCGGNGGECWKSVKTTANDTQMSVGMVVKTRNALEKKGWIKVEQNLFGTLSIRIVDRWLENFNKFVVLRSPDERVVHVVKQRKNHIKNLSSLLDDLPDY